MPSAAFSVVDVFSTTPFRGNPLAVVDNTAAGLTTTQMQLITRQFNLSETTFFQRPTTSKTAYGLRSFLPDGKEVFGAGHNILGAWWHLARSGLLDLETPAHVDLEAGTEQFDFHQELGGEVLPVRISRQKNPGEDADARISVVIRQARPQSHNTHPDPAALAASLGLTVGDLGLADHDTPALPQVMSTSTTRHLIVPLTSEGALRRAVVRRDRLLGQLALADPKAYGLYLFASAPSSTTGAPTYQARFFSPGMSNEDPATASAAGPLAVYLYRHGRVPLTGGMAEVEVRQGEMVGRECLIRVALTLSEDGQSVESDIVGTGVGVAEGRIAVPDASTVF